MVQRDKMLLDLPMLLQDRDSAVSTNFIISSFQEDLKHTYCDCCHGGPDGLTANAEIWTHDHASRVAALEKFIKKWENVWLLKMPDREGVNNTLSLEEEEIIGLVDIESLLGFLHKRQEEGLDFEDKNVRKMANLIAPVPFITATLLADHYGVGSDLGLVRLYLDPYPYPDACRYGSGDTRTQIVKEVMES